MVGPSHTDEERRTATVRLGAGFVGLVAASGGLVALTAGGTLAQLGGGVAGGGAVGLVLLLFLRSLSGQFT